MKKIELRYLYLYLIVYLSIFIGGMFFIDTSLFSKDSGKDSSVEDNENFLEGRYKISKIRKSGDFFRIVFTKINNDRLLPKSVMIESQYVHHALEEGMNLEVSFRIEKDKRNKFSYSKPIELDQILVYLPNDLGGSTPVWMVSKNKEFMGLNGSKFLKMHSPSSDFSIF